MILTENAGIDDLTDLDYKGICDELRGVDDGNGKLAYLSWDKFVLHIGSFRFKAQWANWRADKGNLQWDMKNDLRRAVGLPELPEPVQQVLEKHVHENARIISDMGANEMALRVYLTNYADARAAIDSGLLLEKLDNYTVEIKPKRIKREGFTRPSAVPNSINEWRKANNLTWEAIINYGVESWKIDIEKNKGI